MAHKLILLLLVACATVMVANSISLSSNKGLKQRSRPRRPRFIPRKRHTNNKFCKNCKHYVFKSDPARSFRLRSSIEATQDSKCYINTEKVKVGAYGASYSLPPFKDCRKDPEHEHTGLCEHIGFGFIGAPSGAIVKPADPPSNHPSNPPSNVTKRTDEGDRRRRRLLQRQASWKSCKEAEQKALEKGVGSLSGIVQSTDDGKFHLQLQCTENKEEVRICWRVCEGDKCGKNVAQNPVDCSDGGRRRRLLGRGAWTGC